jgi:hypothetical protein
VLETSCAPPRKITPADRVSPASRHLSKILNGQAIVNDQRADRSLCHTRKRIKHRVSAPGLAVRVASH